MDDLEEAMIEVGTGERVPWRFGAPMAGDFVRPSGRRHFETGEVDAARQHFRDFSDGRIRLNFGTERDFSRMRHFRADVGRTVIETFEFDVAAPHEVLTVPPREAELFLYAPFRGALEIIQGQHRTVVDPGQIVVMTPIGHATRKRWAGACEMLCVRIDRPTMMKMLADEYGLLSDSFLEFEPQVVVDLERVPTLWNYIQTLWNDASQARPCIADSITARSCERTLLLLTVQSFPNNLSTQLERMHAAASPYYVRRVEQYIRANAAQGIAIADMTAVAGVSARSLYYGFQRYLGMSPMKYLKRVRLDGARAALRNARRAHETVTGIALGAGYANLNRFCRDYRARFGETPSMTMRNG
jgi:AraC-like DNA-binding protein